MQQVQQQSPLAMNVVALDIDGCLYNISFIDYMRRLRNFLDAYVARVETVPGYYAHYVKNPLGVAWIDIKISLNLDTDNLLKVLQLKERNRDHQVLLQQNPSLQEVVIVLVILSNILLLEKLKAEGATALLVGSNRQDIMTDRYANDMLWTADDTCPRYSFNADELPNSYTLFSEIARYFTMMMNQVLLGDVAPGNPNRFMPGSAFVDATSATPENQLFALGKGDESKFLLIYTHLHNLAVQRKQSGRESEQLIYQPVCR